MHLAGHTWAWWKHKLKKWGHIPWLSCKQLTCFSQGETGVQTWGASEKKQSMHFSLKPQNGLTTNTAADNQYYHTPGLLPERWIITSRSLHQLCVSEKPTLHFQLLEKFAYNRKKKKKKSIHLPALIQLPLSPTERALMPSQGWSSAFRVTWKSETPWDDSDI